MDLTPLVRWKFVKQAERIDRWSAEGEDIQRSLLRSLLHSARQTAIGKRYDFASIGGYDEFARRVPVVEYEDIRHDVMRMVNGERDVLWRGKCRNFAQSSGTSGGKSKFIPITPDSLRVNHYPGASDAVAAYMRLVPQSKIFSGKGLILGGSFENELRLENRDVKVGDLSANLIENINPVVNLMRVPSKRVALMSDWEKKLPALIEASMKENITNISGVPSWFLTLLRGVMQRAGVNKISDVWPGLEVFFHGGISFEPYRDEYHRITDPEKMHFIETYNASEGFFAAQTDLADRSMQLLLDRGVFYEFMPMGKGGEWGDPVPMWELEKGKTYALIISACNGLWRYSIGDTLRIESVNPLKIRIAGRTKSFINAFGEELMEHNADAAIAATCRECGAAIRNYTAAPVYTTDTSRGRHQWLIEWLAAPSDVGQFAMLLDQHLQRVNSDYQAKRAGNIFLDPLTITTAREGLFDDWLRTVGSGKLGGQRKVPRLSNNRAIIDSMLRVNSVKHQQATDE